MSTLKHISIVILAIVCLTWTTPVIAQDPTPTPLPTASASESPTETVTATPQPASGPIYAVQPGDSLYNIANDFDVAMADLIAANNISNANNISTGAKIIIPGLDGISGILDKQSSVYGDTLRSMSRRDQIPEDILLRLNHFTSPSELYANKKLTYLQKDNPISLSKRINLEAGETLLEASVLMQTDPSTLATINLLHGSWAAIPGDILYTPGKTSDEGSSPSGMPVAFENVTVSPLEIKQGGTVEITVQTAPNTKLTGTLAEKPLNFFALQAGKQIALQGIYTLLAPGLYPLTLEVTQPDGSKQTYQQMLLIQDGKYPTDPLLAVGSDTIDPAENDSEQKQLEALTAPINSTKYWQGEFKNPTLPDFANCHPSFFGDSRYYIGKDTNQTYHSFHAGLDFCEKVGDPISAAADGMVVFTGLLTAHGNTTIIDHGWGVYTMYAHQSQINVQVGQMVKAQDTIGLAGETGRVTGPHLHFEVWVNGIEVNPIDWLNNEYP